MELSGLAQKLQEAIPDSRLVLILGAGHACSVDAVEAFNAVLRRFLIEHSPR